MSPRRPEHGRGVEPGYSRLHDAVYYLGAASQMLRSIGLRPPGSRAVDAAVAEVGQALYGKNVGTVTAARRHVRAALALVGKFIDEPGARSARADLRNALRAMGRE